MTLRKIWLAVLILVSILAIAINSSILTFLTDQYFSDYLEESYELHVNQISTYVKNALTSEEVSYQQMAIELESHLYDPIIGIKLYLPNGQLKVDVENQNSDSRGMMHGMMGGHNSSTTQVPVADEVHQFEIKDGSQTLAIVNITIRSLTENSFVAKRFKGALFTNSLYALVVTLVIVILVGLVVSQKMNRSLKETEALAKSIQMGGSVVKKTTKINEINAIQESLFELNDRLKLKQKSRKTLIDQLVHQTRTPLTILKSHVEAIEDGVIHMSDDECQVFEKQINDIELIIENMSAMIDAEKDIEANDLQEVDIQKLLGQIHAGLKAQFTQKGIQFDVTSHEAIKIVTDPYKLSQAVYNLIINAYKYTPQNGQVTIAYKVLASSLQILVSDTGRGIEPEELESIFKAYYRSPRTADIKGDGIGLYIVKENIEQIGGQIKVVSQINQGTSFTIELPIDIS